MLELREGTYDAEIVKEIKSAYGWLDVKDKLVLDIGACFGAATVLFLENGARHVVAVEPHPDNVRMLKRNTRRFKDQVTVLSGAVAPKDGMAKLFVNAGINTGGHSLHVSRGREAINVHTFDFYKLLAGFRPAVLKVDCEGAEYDFLTKPLPSYVKQISMEIHLNRKEWRQEKAPKLISLFSAWRVVKEPRITESNWHTIGGFKR